jgi:hypothetical protein
MNKENKTMIKILVGVAYLGMIGVNALANILPINNMTTGDISNKYGNLFAPAAITFSIWALIYFLLAAYVVYQFGFFQKDRGISKDKLFGDIGIYFIISSFINSLWIFSWHYNLIWLSAILISILLFCLIKIANILKKENLSIKDKFFIKTPFSIYFGWITVATIANITTFLVSINWNGFGLSNPFWTIIILIIGSIIGIIRMTKDNDLAYGLVFIWAYLGILIKHLSSIGFDGEYKNIIITVIFCMSLLLVSEIFLFINNKLKRHEKNRI